MERHPTKRKKLLKLVVGIIIAVYSVVITLVVLIVISLIDYNSISPTTLRFSTYKKYREYMVAEYKRDPHNPELCSTIFMNQCVLGNDILGNVDAIVDPVDDEATQLINILNNDASDRIGAISAEQLLPEDLVFRRSKADKLQFRLKYSAFRNMYVEGKEMYCGENVIAGPPYEIDVNTCKVRVKANHNIHLTKGLKLVYWRWLQLRINEIERKNHIPRQQ